jgi:hypothetical protein
MHTFIQFVVSLYRFYTLALIFVFDVNIYSSSLRLLYLRVIQLKVFYQKSIDNISF